MNWKVYLNIIVFGLCVFDATSQIVERGPYLQGVTTERIFINWRTDTATDSKIWYGNSPTNLSFTIELEDEIIDHEILIDGLAPNSTYYYAIGTSNGQLVGADSSHYFITSPESAPSQTIRAWVLGDAGTYTDNQRNVRDAYYNYISDEHTDMMLLLGDNAYQDGTDAEYQIGWFENMYEDKLINSIMWPTFGNHDGRSSISITQSGPYYGIFTLPKNGEGGGTPSGTEAYYSFDYGNLHIISLNSDDIDRSVEGDMMQWLQNDLDITNQDWVIVFFHHAPYTGEGGNESDFNLRASEMRENAVPLLEAGGVDLVLSGHTHAYQRSYLIDGHYGVSATWDPDSMGIDLGDGRVDGDGPYLKEIGTSPGNKGTVYVVAGSSGKMDLDDYNHPVMAHNAEKYGSVVIEVNDLQMDVKFIDSDSLVEDYFTIIKQGLPPEVNITYPSNNEYYNAPQTITITADASDPNGSVSEVEFFIDNVSIGIDYTSPYSIDWTIPQNGNYDIKAQATDNEDLIYFSVVSIQSGPSSVCSQVSNNSDDAEEKANGSVSVSSSDLELVFDGSNQIVGMRFLNLNIPQCAVIESADIQFTVDETNNINPSTIQIYGETIDNAPTFSTNNGNLANRQKTIATVTWSPPDWLTIGESGTDQKTIDIAAVVQEIVNREGFTANSSIVILMEGTGKRVAESYNGSSSLAPQICIEYVPFGPDDDDDGTCNANDICPGNPEPGSPCDDENTGTYNDAIDSNCDCIGIPYDCPAFPANIGDVCNDGDPGTYNDIVDSTCTCIGIPYECPLIQGDIGDVCNDGDPGTYNDIVDSTCTCIGIPYDCPSIPANIGDLCDDGNPNTANDAIDSNCECVGIFYDCPNVPGNIGDPCDDGDPNSNNDIIDEYCVCIGITTINSNISANSDDAEEGPNGAVSLTSSDLEMVIDGGDIQTIGLRFINLDIPKGADILNAYIQFTVDQTDNVNPSTLDIFGEAADNALTFSANANDISSRPKTISSITWSPSDWLGVGDVGPDQQTDDISSIIQEIVDRDGYTINSSIAFIIEGDGKRTAISRDGNSNDAPELIVLFKCKDNDNDGICDLCPSGFEPGSPCDDGDPGTYNDIVDSTCICIGIPYDCPLIPGNIGDSCDDGNPNTSNDIVDSNCECLGSYDCPLIQANIGDSCDDGDPNTLNDMIDSNCDCNGTFYDCPSFPANIDDSCDDGDPNTSNDIINSNCECLGSYDCPSIPGNIGDSCDDGNPNTSNDMINSNCECAGEYDCPSFPANIGDSCDDENANTINDEITSNCECLGTFYDCPSFPANIGDSCDDGDPNTSNDMIDSNCECIGGYDCPSIPGNIGDSCDDGDPNTSNDMINSNCECAGEYDCPSFPANIGDPCDDENANTINDEITSNCECLGTYYDCPSFPANIGDACDDDNPETSNDVITSNCECLGSYDCPSFPANIGDPCDDGNPNTSNDVITSNCECLGSYDCPSIQLNIGDPCDDGDPGTFNDAVDSNCDCVGISYDCPNIPGNFGDPCDDDNPNSTNDIITSDCFCLGSITILSAVNKSSDDAEEKTNGTVNVTSSDLEMIIDGNNEQTIGIRFENLNIPQGAQIDFAFIQFTADQTDNINPSNLDIYGEASDNAVTFVNSSFNITNRPKTIETLIWSPADWQNVGDDGPEQQTVNIASIVQEIVDRSGFTSSSSIVIIIEGVGKRTAVSYNGNANQAPKLIVTYKCSDSNNDNICDICPGGPQPEESCDDGDPGTYDDTTDLNCDCIGIPYDCPSFPANIGDPCDDGNSETSNDVITSNCECLGSYDCPSFPANIGDPCDDGNSETSNDVITSNCECLGSYDCPSFPANIGDTCDDGDPGTYNDLIDSNCNCVGTPYDCPSFPANIGDACDDSNPETSNDMITSNCECLGSYDCPLFPANIGDSCDDGNPETSNDIITSNCECIGVYDCPSIPANIGDSCDDGNSETYNDTINSNCECEGDAYECPNIPGNIGDQCDDGDPNTSNDIIDVNCICHGSFTSISSINQSSDDAEENASGAVSVTSSDLEMIIDRNDNQIIGLRFVNINIPQGADIESAFVQFAADQVDNVNPSNLNIFGEASDNAATFSNTNGNISNRPKTVATSSWSPADWEGVGDAGPAQKTVNIASIIQEIVDRAGFTSSSPIAIIIDGEGKRTADSYDGNASQAPNLIVTYKCNDSNNDGFCDTCPGGDEPGDACDDGDSGTYNDTIDSNCECAGIPYDCPSVPADIGDSCDDGDSETYNDVIDSICLCVGTPFDCPSLQVNIGDPCDDGDPNTTNDSIDPNCECLGTPIVYDFVCTVINTSTDDAEEKPNGSLSVTSSDLELVIDGGGNQMIGLRFTNLNIPKGANISNAEIQFTVDQTDNVNPCNLEIYGEASDDATTFGGNSNISNREKTLSSETWSPADWLNVNDAGPDQKTINIASVIQEIVDRSGYTSNSAIVIIIEGVGKRTARSFNGNSSQAPELCVEYSDPPQGFMVYDNPATFENGIQLNATDGHDNTRKPLNERVNIYPNPATDKLMISLKAFQDDEINIQILDLNGRKVFAENRNVNEGINDILLENIALQNGIYFIQLYFNERVYSSKITIMKIY